jgi:hypothetical protein
MPHNFADGTPQTARLFKLALGLALVIAVVRGAAIALSAQNVFDLSGNDDIMRMMSVRNWRDGQSWFDMTQYQLLAPDGVSIHWSRYIDFGIGALVFIFGLVMSTPLAEQWAAAVWPLLLLGALVLVVGYGTRRVLEPMAAAISMLSVVLYPAIGFDYFSVGRIDHHNVQILLMTIALFATILPDRPILFGAVAGIAAAASLAIGLEGLFFIAAIGLLHVFRAASSAPEPRTRLAAYCAAIAVFSLIFFLGQTAPHGWFVSQCDKLSPPYLLISAMGAFSGVAALTVPASQKHPAVFIAIVGAVTGIGLYVGWSVISPCLQSPYSNLPQIAQVYIQERISEALPLHVHAAADPLIFMQYFGPAIVALVAATAIWLRERHLGRQSDGVWQVLFIGWIGFVACIIQNRQIVLLAVVTPFLTGYAVRLALQSFFSARTGRSRAVLWAAVALTLFQPVLSSAFFGIWNRSPRASPVAATQNAKAQPKWKDGLQDERCNNLQTLARLNAIPSGRVLSSLNLGPRLIMTTHHIAMAAPYHRNADAIMNGFVPFSGTAATLTQTATDQEIDYIVVCRRSNYGDGTSIGTRLASGETVPGFTAMALDDPNLMIFRLTEPQ